MAAIYFISLSTLPSPIIPQISIFPAHYLFVVVLFVSFNALLRQCWHCFTIHRYFRHIYYYRVVWLRMFRNLRWHEWLKLLHPHRVDWYSMNGSPYDENKLYYYYYQASNCFVWPTGKNVLLFAPTNSSFIFRMVGLYARYYTYWVWPYLEVHTTLFRNKNQNAIESLTDECVGSSYYCFGLAKNVIINIGFYGFCLDCGCFQITDHMPWFWNNVYPNIKSSLFYRECIQIRRLS